MLYLNAQAKSFGRCRYNLTLTSVVFEFTPSFSAVKLLINLTLTSVVFESLKITLLAVAYIYLTLTSVVFECDTITFFYKFC